MKRFTGILASLALLALLAVPAWAQTVPVYPSLTFKNLLANPRMDIYPLNTTTAYTPSTITSTLTGLNTTPTYLAARWAVWANNASASVTVANTTSSTVLPTGFANGITVQRAASNANLTQICLGQEIKSSDVQSLQGQPMTLSGWVTAGANFSGTGVQLVVFSGTGTDQGLVTQLSGWTGASTPLSSTQAITTTATRYAATFTVPSSATELTAAFCWTPVGTAGTNDQMTVTGAQLEFGSLATALENRPQAVENTNMVLPYTQVLTDTNVEQRFGMCYSLSTTVARCALTLPVTMRAAPTPTVQASTSFGVSATINTGQSNACSTLAGNAVENTTDSVWLQCTTTGLTAGQGNEFVGAATGKFVLFSADF